MQDLSDNQNLCLLFVLQIYQVLHASQTARLAFLAPLKVERTIVNGKQGTA